MRVALTFWLILLFFSGFTQETSADFFVDVQHFDESDGLSSRHVHQTFQDRRGVTWFVTESGVDVFDGVVFHKAISFPFVSAYPEVRIRAEDTNGYLWIRYKRDGRITLQLIHAVTRTLKNPGEVIRDKRIGEIHDVAIDASGQLIVLNTQGELWQAQHQDTWRKISTGLTNFEFKNTRFSGEGIWVYAEFGDDAKKVFARIDPDTKQKIERITPKFFAQKESEVFVDSLFIVSVLQDAMIMTPSGEWASLKFPPALRALFTGEAQGIEFGMPTTQGVQVLYLISGGRLAIVHIHHNQVIQFSQIPTNKYFKPGAMNIFSDNQGNLWIGGIEGVSRIRIIPQRFTRINWVDPTSGHNYLLNSVRGIVEGPNGIIYMFSGGYLYAWNPKNKQIKVVRENRNISALIADLNKGSISAANFNYEQYFPASGKTIKYPLSSRIREYGGEAWALYDDGQGIWIGSSRELVYLKHQDHSVSIVKGYDRFPELLGADIYFFQRKGPRELWVLSSIGLYILHLDKGLTHRYGNMGDGTAVNWLPSLNFRHLYEEGKEVYWFATQDGLLYWDKKKGIKRLYTTKDGLPSNDLYAVYPDGQEYLWINSANGIIQFNIAGNFFRTFQEKDGIAHIEGNRIAHTRASDGTLYFGGLNGVTAFHPRNFREGGETSTIPELLLMSATVLDGKGGQEKDLLQSFATQKKMVLSWKDRYLNLQFALPYYVGTTVDYRFKVLGLHKNWIQTSLPVVRLVSLNYGNFTVLMEARTTNRSTVTKSLRIPVHVRPPFILRWWVLLGIGILFVLFVWAVIRYRLDRMHKRQQELEREVEIRTEKIQTDKRTIEQQAKELLERHEEKTRFFANVTHEFRTPLALILGPIRSIMSRPYLKRREVGLLNIAENNAGRLLDLVEEIMMLSSLETQHLKINREYFSASVFVQGLLDEYAVLATQKQIVLTLESSLDATRYVHLDTRIFRILLNNLLSNAFKYTPKNGTIRVSLEGSNQQIQVQVADNGRGIYPEDMPHVFERYYQTRRSGASTEGGTGIGLALSSELVEKLGGTISVESTPGKGSTFTVVLPTQTDALIDVVSPVSGPSASSTESVPDKKKASQKLPVYQKSDKTILMVEDTVDFRQFLQFLLEDSYHVSTASNGKEALELLEGGLQPVLIISDLMMPEMDGYQLLKAVRQSARFGSIPFLMLTARAAYEDKELALQLGVDDYLVKPFLEETLLVIADELIRRYAQRQEQVLSKVEKEMHYQEEKQRHQQEKAWLRKLEQETNRRMSSDTFSVDELATAMLLGRTNFFLEVKRLTGLTPNQYIQESRLVKARYILETEPNITIRSVITQVGLRDERYFVKAFKKRFGNLPSYYK